MASKHESAYAIDIYVNEARREKQGVTIFLLDGGVVRGRVIGFDKNSVVVSSNRRRYLIYKHAISTIARFHETAKLESNKGHVEAIGSVQKPSEN